MEDNHVIEKRSTLKYNIIEQESVEKFIENLTLFDDDFMAMVFDENIPVTELVLKIILNREDIQVISVSGQKELENPVVDGRNIKLDILIKDKAGKYYNIEIQRSSAGATERRARFHSSMLDSRMLKQGQNFTELPDSYIIFITEKDYFGKGLPIYTITRQMKEYDDHFRDGSHIIYVNGSYHGNDAIGMLLDDFRSRNVSEIHYPEIAESIKHFKSEGGQKSMGAIREYARQSEIKGEIKASIEYGIDKERVIARLCSNYSMDREEAEAYYDYFSGETA